MRQLAGVQITPRKIGWALLAVVACVAIALLYRRIDPDAVQSWALRMDGWAVFGALTLLPMFGFPVTILHVAAGVKYGFWLGLLLVGVSIFIQQALSYWLVTLMPDFFARRFAGLRDRLPRTAHKSVTLFTLLMPGAPYFAQNYVLPLVGVPFGIYMWIGVPMHWVRSIIAVIFGEVFTEFTWQRAVGFALYGATIMLIWGWSFRRLRAQLQDRPPAAGGRTQRA
jgi:uncharacterized membrane protein YdjX (TVP38/TMEM64 family)